jgi:hypothetical protein
MRQAGLVISVDDYLWFVESALEDMAGLVRDLGDGLAQQRPDLPGANSPYAVLTHCLGVCEYWVGHVVAGRVIERDREAEFRASGPVADLLPRVERAREQLRRDLVDLDPQAPPRGQVRPRDAGLPYTRTQGGALLHVLEELAQHLGQLELTRDVLRCPWARLSGEAGGPPPAPST